MWTFRGEDPKAEARLFRPGVKDGKLSAIPPRPPIFDPGIPAPRPC